ncbi:MAG TPA: hypothetical protein GX504_07010 [Clostridia bacterium]|nr:hypothetical protein [Clostridia bacterium]
MRFRQEILNLLDSAIPFLNPKGQRIVQTTQSLVELLQSPAATRAAASLHSLSAPTGTLEESSGKRHTHYNPFSLFLVLYLLILATDHQHCDRPPAQGYEHTSRPSLPSPQESDASPANPFPQP